MLHHEDFVEHYKEVRRGLCSSSDKSLMFVTVDWSSAIEFRSRRQDGREFFNKVVRQMMGMSISIPGRPGGGREYVHGYIKEAGFPKTAVRTTFCVEYLLAKCLDIYKEEVGLFPSKLVLAMDTAQHFRNKVLICRLLRDSVLTKKVKVELMWSPENHGKTELDGSFRLAKSWVADINGADYVKNGAMDLVGAISSCYDQRRNYHGCVVPEMSLARPFGVQGIRRIILDQVKSVHSIADDGCNLQINKYFSKLDFCKGRVVTARFQQEGYQEKPGRSRWMTRSSHQVK